jgi:RNase_H superfamily
MATKILCFDDESTELSAEGDLLVFGYKWIGAPAVGGTCADCGKRHSRVFTPSVLDGAEPCDQGRIHYSDKSLIKLSHDVLSEADMVVTFNGKNFDWKLQNTKFLMAGLKPVPAIAHVDLYQVARSNILIRPKSLKNLARVFKFKHQKTALDFNVWRRAAKGDPSSLRYIRDHCRADVLVTEEAYFLFRNNVRQHPRISGWGPCRRCGADALERRGEAVTIYKGQQYRFQCRKCGGWETKLPEE